MTLWIPVTIAAAFFQNLRSALQKHLTGVLSGQGAAYSRFLFALPWALLYLFLVVNITDSGLPTPNVRFLTFSVLGAISQILATVFLLMAFSFRSFAVGTVISKLEIVIVALLGLWLLGDRLNMLAQLGILLSTLGLLALSAGQNKLTPMAMLKGMREPATAYGLLAALGLGGSVIFFRGASLSLQFDQPFVAAAFTLAIALVIQTVIMGIWLTVREPGQITEVIRSWRWSALVGITGMLASIGWFTAFTLQNASYVRALGQIELLFTFLVTTRVFRESVSRLEYAGCALIVGGILVLLIGARA